MNYLADYFTKVSTGTRLPLTQFESDVIGLMLMIGMVVVIYIVVAKNANSIQELWSWYFRENPNFTEAIHTEETVTAKEDSDVIMWDIFDYPDYDINIRVDDQED